MAIDSYLLQNYSRTAVLRFYVWRGPWLSIGRNQTNLPKHWIELAESKVISIVRRISGGNAVLHAGGLTYALIWPMAPRGRLIAYEEACNWLIKGFRELGMHLSFGKNISNLKCQDCFTQSTPADLVDSNGIKRIGSAQRCK